MRLDEDSYLRVIKRYTSRLKYNIEILFTNKISDFGLYTFDSKIQTHKIKISIKKCSEFEKSFLKFDTDTEKYYVISTTLHEIKHAIQYEKLGLTGFTEKEFSSAANVKNSFASSYFSSCEIEAKEYEFKHLIKAVACYNSACKRKSSVL